MGSSAVPVPLGQLGQVAGGISVPLTVAGIVLATCTPEEGGSAGYIR